MDRETSCEDEREVEAAADGGDELFEYSFFVVNIFLALVGTSKKVLYKEF